MLVKNFAIFKKLYFLMLIRTSRVSFLIILTLTLFSCSIWGRIHNLDFLNIFFGLRYGWQNVKGGHLRASIFGALHMYTNDSNDCYDMFSLCSYLTYVCITSQDEWLQIIFLNDSFTKGDGFAFLLYEATMKKMRQSVEDHDAHF